MFNTLILFFSCLTALLATKLTDIPNPTKEARKCGRETVNATRICDSDYFLSTSTKDWFDQFTVTLGRDLACTKPSSIESTGDLEIA